jgi:UDP-N-acetyl-2-amino-2-deoxyglucuronate dehydrogenase
MNLRNKKNINVAFVGLGRVFDHYLYIIKKFKLKNFNISCISDSNPKKLNFYKKKLRVDGFLNYKDIANYKTKIDLVIILTPSGMHYEHSLFFLKFFFNVITEKPITMRPAEGMMLAKIAKKNKLMFGSVFQNRFNPALKYLKNITLKKKLGKITSFSARVLWCRNQSYYNDGWHGTWGNDGGVINQQAIHHIDAINWLLGPIKEVNAFKYNALNKLEAEDSMVLLIKLKNGVVGTFQATTSARPKDLVAEICILGKNGYATVDGQALNNLGKIEFLKKYKKVNKKKFSQKVKNGYGFGHADFLKKTISRLQSRIIEPLICPSDSIYVTRVIHAIYKSCDSKKWTKITKNVLYDKLGRKNV